jgi:hypothetical protein
MKCEQILTHSASVPIFLPFIVTNRDALFNIPRRYSTAHENILNLTPQTLKAPKMKIMELERQPLPYYNI